MSLKASTRDWEGLRRKLRAGKTVELAAIEMGIPLDEVKAWVDEQEAARAFDDLTWRESAHAALETAMRTLRKVAKQGPRTSTTERDGERVYTCTPVNSDVDAARALLKFAEGMRKGGVKEKLIQESAKGNRDLFDHIAQSIEGPWTFNPPKV